MPNYKNQFSRPMCVDHEIISASGQKIGLLRVKPSGLLWKPVNQQKFYSISLDQFTTWITNTASGAQRSSS